MPRLASKHTDDFLSGSPQRPHGAPRGLLVYYILQRIAQKPVHGYEILQDIDSKTDGAWRPGAGSVYPILKRLVKEGMIKAYPSSETEQHVYHITPKGQEHLVQAKQMFADVGKKWTSMRRIFMEFLDAKDLGSFFIDGTRSHFQMAQEIMESKSKNLSPSEARFIVREYALNLERQSEWCDSFLRKLEKSSLEERKSYDAEPIKALATEGKK